MSSEEIIKVVDKLVGKISPVGESNTDRERFENLEVLCEVLNHYHVELFFMRYNKDRYEASVKRIGDFADKFIKETVEYYGED